MVGAIRFGSSERQLLGILGLLTTIEVTAIDIYMPALPKLQRLMDVSPAHASLTVSIFLAGLAAGQALYGPLSDRYGRRPPLIFGLGVYLLGSALPLAAPTFGWFMVSRLLQALGAAAGLVIPRAVVTDRFDPTAAARAYSVLMQLLGIAATLAPLLGGYLAVSWGWQSIFYALTGLGVLCLVLVYAGLDETLPVSGRASGGVREQFTVAIRLTEDRSFLAFCLALAAGMASLFTLLTGSSFIFIEQYGWSPGTYSLLYGAGAFGFVLMGYANTRALRHRSPLWLLWCAESVQMALAVALVLVSHLPSAPAWAAAVLMTLLLSNLGFLFGNLNAVAMNRARRSAGIGASIVGVAQFAISALAGPAAGSIVGSPLVSSAWTIAAFCALSLLSYVAGAASMKGDSTATLQSAPP